MPVRTNPDPLATFRSAQHQGYLLCNSRENRAAIMKYCGWCQRFNVPQLLVHYPQSTNARYCVLDLDFPCNCWDSMLLDALNALFAEHNAGPRYSVTPSHAYATRIPTSRAPFVAARAAELACRLVSAASIGGAA